MKNTGTVSSTLSIRSTLATSLALAFLTPGIAAAQDPPVVHTAAGDSATAKDHTGWSFNATPVLVLPEDGYGWGGGADPELKYTLDFGTARVSLGGRVGAYYAKDLFGLSAMPTLRITVPWGALEPYASAGVGYGWLPTPHHEDVMTMARAGFVYRFSKTFAVGLEGTHQQLRGSEHRFFSIGSMMAVEL